VSAKLIPEGLLDKYIYTEGDYYYSCVSRLKNVEIIDKALMYLVYNNSTYTSAKDYVFENMLLDDSYFYTFNGYVFYINLRYDDIPEEEKSYSDMFPYFYNIVAINDEKNEIVFFGLYVPYDYNFAGKEEIKTNFVEHLKYFYGEWYNFFD
jgi:hypothetical protein